MKRHLAYVSALLILIQLATSACSSDDAPPDFDWKRDWAARAGYSIEIDTEGYDFPSAIAFVPDPGESPGDPLYFVTELRGQVKVVTNDRAVHTFAKDFFQLVPEQELPDQAGEVGLTGICLAPSQGYVFVTFAYQDSDKIIRNNIARFQSTPDTFSTTAISRISFPEIFAADEADVSHQIGACQIEDDLLYVSVGDGEKPIQSRRVDSTLGKILRMTLDGEPLSVNPFFQDNGANAPEDYVWSYGFRNPFGMKIVDGRIFVADNGPAVDRFVEVREGQNYLYDGTDQSIGTNAIAVLSPGYGMAQVDYLARDSSTLPRSLEESFFLVVSGSPAVRFADLTPEILNLRYDLDTERLLEVPESFLKYTGSDLQVLAGVGVGPDGLYYVPLLPNRLGMSAILRISHDPANEHPFLIEQELDAKRLMRTRGCLGCHTLDDRGGSAAPPLDREVIIPRIQARLESEEYLLRLKEVDLLDREPFVSFRQARQEVIQAEGLEKVRTWIRYRVQEPRFDSATARMPNLGLSDREAVVIADFLSASRERTFLDRVADVLPARVRRRHLLFFFVGGFLAGAFALAGSYLVLRTLRGRS